MSMFYVGQPVVCVNGTLPHDADRFPQIAWPIEGRHYRIRGIYGSIRTKLGHDELTFVLVHGIRNPHILWADGVVREAAFFELRFAPATSIDSLRDILQQQPRTKRRRRLEDA